jgi:2'-5' RNA ligase
VQAIVATVPQPHAGQVEELWAALEERFGVHSHLTTEFPHFSLHMAASYPREELEDKLRAFAAEHPPLRVRTAGLGMFTKGRQVLYVPVVRNPRLNDFHRELWRAVSGLGDDVAAYYRPERWLPHITLALERIDQYNLGGVIHWLSDQKLDWVFDVSELSLLSSEGEDREECFRVPLEGTTGTP